MKKILIAIAVIIVLFLGYNTFSKSSPTKGVSDDQAELVLFWGDGCPHCKIVEDFVSENKVNDVVKIAYKEVYYNKTNQQLLLETVKKCPDIDTKNGIGVPLAFIKSDSKCLYGDQPITDWLKTKMVK